MSNQKILELINNYNVNRILFTNDIENKLYINKQIGHIYIINLDSDRLRRNYVIRLMEKYKINFELIIVPTLDDSTYNSIGNNKIKIGEAGCYLSHMYCLNDAIKNNYDKIIIFEDDIILHKEFHSIFEENMEQNEFDIFMLGASDFSFSKCNNSFVNKKKLMYRPNIQTVYLCGTYGILYSNKGYNTVFNVRLENATFMDDNLMQFLECFPNTFYVSYPSLVAVDVSDTNIDHHFWITKPLRDNYYYKNCFNNQFEFSNYNFIYLKLLKDYVVNTNLSYEDNILAMIDKLFKNDLKKKEIIKKRLEVKFFTTNDLNFMINN
jgi:GR25 family glycosyltransferase involved in LPS biosynthesis